MVVTFGTFLPVFVVPYKTPRLFPLIVRALHADLSVGMKECPLAMTIELAMSGDNLGLHFAFPPIDFDTGFFARFEQVTLGFALLG